MSVTSPPTACAAAAATRTRRLLKEPSRVLPANARIRGLVAMMRTSPTEARIVRGTPRESRPAGERAVLGNDPRPNRRAVAGGELEPEGAARVALQREVAVGAGERDAGAPAFAEQGHADAPRAGGLVGTERHVLSDEDVVVVVAHRA